LRIKTAYAVKITPASVAMTVSVNGVGWVV